jgi:hypothetical protein
LAFAYQRSIIAGCSPRFLYEPVQGHQMVLAEANQYSRRSISRQVRSHFPQPFPHGAAQRQSRRPAPMSAQQVLPIAWRSASSKLFSQSRTGSLPAMVRKKTSGTFRGDSCVAMRSVYHIKYDRPVLLNQRLTRYTTSITIFG